MLFPGSVHHGAKIQRMVKGLLLTTAVVVLVDVNRETCDCLRQNPHTGIHGCHLHGRALIDTLAGSCCSKEETIRTSAGSVGRARPGMEQATEDTHKNHSPYFDSGIDNFKKCAIIQSNRTRHA